MTLTQIALLLLLLFAVSALFNYLILKWTKTLGAKDQNKDGQLRWSADYKPAVGGISFYLIFLISFLIYQFTRTGEFGLSSDNIYLGILIIVSLGFFTGLADDAFNTVPWLKFGAQVACGILLLVFNIRIEFFDHALADSALTIFWTVSVMNSINMLDNMDAVTSIVCIFILLSAAVSASPLAEANVFYTYICGGTMAAIAGFLIFNWNPSRMFMGDTGSQMLGALLAIVGVLFFWNNDNVVVGHHWWSKISLVAVAFIVPIADSATVTINRLRRGQSPFVGGRDHTTHHLSYAGLSDRQVAMVLTSISAGSLVFVALLRFISEENRMLFSIGFTIYAALCFIFLYSTTHWKKSKAIFESKYLHKNGQ